MNKTVLITGASRGIGYAAAQLFAQNGYRVVIHFHRSEQRAQELAGKLNAAGYSALAVQADLSVRADVTHMFEQVQQALGPVGVLINNAGIAQQKLFTDLTDQDWQQMFDVNVTGMFYTCQCALPEMIRQKQGCILNVSSMWGITGASCEVHYSAAKAAVIGLTKALAKEVGPSGIRVNCIAPGVIDTDMLANLTEADKKALCEDTPLGKLGTPTEIAELMLFLASDKAGFITGQTISPNGGYVIA